MLNKIGITMFLVGFWLVFPAILMLFQVGGVNTIIENPENVENPSIFTSFSLFGKLGEIYFNMFFFNIPEWNFGIKLFLNFLQIISFITLVLVIRGGGD